MIEGHSSLSTRIHGQGVLPLKKYMCRFHVSVANIFTFFSEKHQSQTFINLSGRSNFREIHKNPDSYSNKEVTEVISLHFFCDNEIQRKCMCL